MQKMDTKVRNNYEALSLSEVIGEKHDRNNKKVSQNNGMENKVKRCCTKSVNCVETNFV